MIKRIEIADRLEWMRTGHLLAMLANIHRDSKKRPDPYTWEDWSPYDLDDIAPTTPGEVTADHRKFGELMGQLMSRPDGK